MQVSWIEAEDLKGLLARIALPENGPSAPKAAEPSPALLAEPEDPFIITGLDAPVPDPFDAVAPAAAFVDSQPAVAARTFSPSPAPAPIPAPAPGADMPPHEEEPVAPDQTAAILPLSRIRDKLRAIRQRAHEAGILGKTVETNAPAPSPETRVSRPDPAPSPPAPDAAPPPAPLEKRMPSSAPEDSPPDFPVLPLPPLPPFEPPAGSIQARLSAFATWARHALHEDGGHLLVMNDHGELLWGGEAKTSLVLSTMMAWSATLRASAHAACGDLPVMRQSLASGHVLTVIPCETAPRTLLHIAVAAPEALPETTAFELRKALVVAMTGKPD